MASNISKITNRLNNIIGQCVPFKIRKTSNSEARCNSSDLKINILILKCCTLQNQKSLLVMSKLYY